MMAILNVIIEREGRNWRKKVVVQVHIPPYKAFSGMVVLLMCLHCYTLLWHVFWGALKHANGIEGGIVVRVIACFQPLHNCQPMTALGEQMCQSVVIMLERLCTANHSRYAMGWHGGNPWTQQNRPGLGAGRRSASSLIAEFNWSSEIIRMRTMKATYFTDTILCVVHE
ncbi:hypothetical protein HN51_023617 [Arachis hypogaea]